MSKNKDLAPVRNKSAEAAVTISTWLRPKQFKALEQAVASSGVSRSAFIRSAVEKEITRLEQVQQ